MMNIILGSGIIGCLAKKILGANWTFIPFKKSRYYSWEIPFADNFVVYDSKIDGFMSEFCSDIKIFTKRPFSYHGQLMYQNLPMTVDPYLRKVYGDDVPDIADKLLKTTYTVYSESVLNLYSRIQQEQYVEIQSAVDKYGRLIGIDLDARVIGCEKQKLEYDKIISTIPLDVLCKYCNLSMSLKSKSVCYYVIDSDKVDIEGADQCFVSDLDIDFFKVQKIDKNRYAFWTFEPIDNPYQYFGAFLGYQLDIIEAKRIENVIAMGNAPDLDHLVANDIMCIGSNAQWDDFMDVSSCINRLLSLKF